MWAVSGQPATWPRIAALVPDEVLDDYDGPKLFTMRSEDGGLLLAYQCGEERSLARFLLVPFDEALVSELRSNKLALRDALTQRGWAWIVDRFKDGSLSPILSVDPLALPRDALPKPGVTLFLRDDVLLRIRMMGRTLGTGAVPASVVRKTIDGATGAIRTLAAHAMSMQPLQGRPSDQFRKYYDLPALEFGFRSFEIAFGKPDVSGDLQLGEQSALERVESLLSRGLAWAASSSDSLPETSDEWSSIVEALAKLAPPLSGPIEIVEVSGSLAGRKRKPLSLTRHSAERIAAARKIMIPDKRSRTYEGFVRELDKDKQTFILRDARATNLAVLSFGSEQEADVWLAFETNRLVTITFYETTAPHDLITISFGGPEVTEAPA